MELEQEVAKTEPEKRKDRRREVFCSFTKMVSIGEVKGNPKNANKHDREQIEILANAIMATGWRTPIGVSKRSGFIVRGHGRFEAAKALGLTEVPVDFQEYDSDAQELTDLLADNQIAELSETDYQAASKVLHEIPQDQLMLTGFRDFEFLPLLAAEWAAPAVSEMPLFQVFASFKSSEAEAETIRKAIKLVQSKTKETLTDGQCLEAIANSYLSKVILEENIAALVKPLHCPPEGEPTPKIRKEDLLLVNEAPAQREVARESDRGVEAVPPAAPETPTIPTALYDPGPPVVAPAPKPTVVKTVEKQETPIWPV